LAAPFVQRKLRLSTAPSICHHRSEFPKSLLCIEAGTIVRLPRGLIGLDIVWRMQCAVDRSSSSPRALWPMFVSA
jgi:hypothetical protein